MIIQHFDEGFEEFKWYTYACPSPVKPLICSRTYSPKAYISSSKEGLRERINSNDIFDIKYKF